MAVQIDGFSVKTSCLATVLNIGNPNNKPCIIVGYAGGYTDAKDWNVWWEEIENSVYIDDIFMDSETPPDEPGLYVWEGKVTPVFDDAPEFDGAWRKAEADDFLKFSQATL